MSSLLTAYLEFFGLKRRPFSLLPDPEFLYWSPEHTRADAMLKYSMETCAPITVITGEIGSGKTTLLREMLRTMEDKVTIGLVSNTQGGQKELMQWVLMSLGLQLEHSAGYVQMFQQFQNFLIDEYAAGRHTILIFDEAQNFEIETLEELRMLTNINADTDPLLQVILVGQPELANKILDPRLVQFAQRVAAEAHLKNLSEEEVKKYILHRLKVAGSNVQVFADNAFGRIYHGSHGTPRLINQICEYALVYAYSMDKKVIDAETIDLVLADRTVLAVSPAKQPVTESSTFVSRNAERPNVKLVEPLRLDQEHHEELRATRPEGPRRNQNAKLRVQKKPAQEATGRIEPRILPKVEKQPVVDQTIDEALPVHAHSLDASEPELPENSDGEYSPSLDILHRAERALGPKGARVQNDLVADNYVEKQTSKIETLTTKQPDGKVTKLKDVHTDGVAPKFPGAERR